MTQPLHAPDILAAVAARMLLTLERPSTSDNCAISRHALAPVFTTSIHRLAGSFPGIWYGQRDPRGVENSKRPGAAAPGRLPAFADTGAYSIGLFFHFVNRSRLPHHKRGDDGEGIVLRDGVTQGSNHVHGAVSVGI